MGCFAFIIALTIFLLNPSDQENDRRGDDLLRRTGLEPISRTVGYCRGGAIGARGGTGCGWVVLTTYSLR